MSNVSRSAYHEASLVLFNSAVVCRRLGLFKFEVRFFTGEINGVKYELIAHGSGVTEKMAQLSAIRKLRRNFVARAIEKHKAEVAAGNEEADGPRKIGPPYQAGFATGDFGS